MHFAWTDCNHSREGHETLHDPKLAITGMLVDLGHTVSKSGFALETAPAINLIFEGFTEEGIEMMRKARAQGLRFVIVCTEQFGLSGSFNDSPYPDMVERQRLLPPAAEIAEACWCLVPGMAEQLRPFNRNSFDIELGYSTARERLLHAEEEPIFDFCFHGGALGRRQLVIDELRRLGCSVVTPRQLMTPAQKAWADSLVHKDEIPMSDYGPLSVRNKALAQAKVSLGLRPRDGWKLASSARFQAALHVGRPVLAEEIEDDPPTPWRKIIPFVKTEQLYDIGLLAASRWRDAYAKQMAAFRHYLSPQKAIGHAIAGIA